MRLDPLRLHADASSPPRMASREGLALATRSCSLKSLDHEQGTNFFLAFSRVTSKKSKAQVWLNRSSRRDPPRARAPLPDNTPHVRRPTAPRRPVLAHGAYAKSAGQRARAHAGAWLEVTGV